MCYHTRYFPPTIKWTIFDNDRNQSPPIFSEYSYRRKIFEQSDVVPADDEVQVNSVVLNQAQHNIVGVGKLSSEPPSDLYV
jgi:hypothetical protein